MAVFVFGALLVGPADANQLSNEKELQGIPMEQREFARYLQSMRDDHGFEAFTITSFGQGGFDMAITQFRKPGQEVTDAPKYTAAIQTIEKQPQLVFRIFAPCVEDTQIRDVAFRVDGQKVAGYALCRRNTKGQGYVETFFTKSKSAVDFVRARFASKDHVYVEFDRMPIAFATTRFTTYWDKEAEPAM